MKICKQCNFAANRIFLNILLYLIDHFSYVGIKGLNS